MDQRVKRLLQSEGGNHIFPFFGYMEKTRVFCVNIWRLFLIVGVKQFV